MTFIQITKHIKIIIKFKFMMKPIIDTFKDYKSLSRLSIFMIYTTTELEKAL